MAPEPLVTRAAPMAHGSERHDTGIHALPARGSAPTGPVGGWWRNGYFLAIAGCTLLFLVIGARWIWLYRIDQPFDIDEAGYLGMAFRDYYALMANGVIGWFAQVNAPNAQAPLTSALASLLFYAGRPLPVVGFAVPLLAGAATVIATYFLGRAVASRPAGLASAILLASCPLILNYSRSFHFAVPATLIVTLAMLALILSRRFDRVGWTLVFGVSLGLMPLARTMTIAFLPGIIFGAVVYLLADPSHRVRRGAHFAVAVVVAFLVAGIWLWPNGRLVFQYLFSFGYGSRAVEFGSEQSMLGLDAWLETLRGFGYQVYLPHLGFLLLSGIALAGVAVKDLFKSGAGRFVQKVLKAPILPVLIAVAVGLFALTSSRNKGSAFFAPLVPLLLVAAVWALFHLCQHRYYRIALVYFVAMTAVVAAVPLIGVSGIVAAPRFAQVPWLGRVPVTDGRGTIQLYEAVGGLGATDEAEVLSREAGQAWVRLDQETAATIVELKKSCVAFGFRHYLYNVNTVNLQQLISAGRSFSAMQVEPVLTGDSLKGYLDWVVSASTADCVLLTSDTAKNEFFPTIDRVLMRQAAVASGYIQVEQRALPDGQTVTLWRHPGQ